MQKFYIHRTQPAYVTEIIEVEAESNSAARQCAIDGIGDTTLGLVVGDYLDAPDTVEVFDAAPHNIPMGFLPINGEAMMDLVRQLARMDPPDERDEIAEVDGEIEAFSHMIRKAKEIMGGTAPEIPATPATPADIDILDWSGPEEGDTCDLSVWITDDCGNELYEITEGGDVESNKEIARRVVESINAIRTTGGRLTIEQATALVPEYAASVAAEGR